MTLIDYHRKFWKEYRKKPFTPNETLLFSYLLDEWNNSGRKELFECNTKEIELVLCMNKMTLSRCRENLRKRGVIQYVKGNRKVNSPYYSFEDVTNNVTKDVTNSVTNDVTTHRVLRDKENIILSTHACEKNDYLMIDAIAPFLKSETFWISSVTERIYRNHKILLTSDEFNEWIDMYVLKLKTDGETSKFKDNAKSHFTNWLLIETGKKLKDERTAKNSRTPTRPNFDNFNEEEARQVGRINSIEL